MAITVLINYLMSSSGWMEVFVEPGTEDKVLCLQFNVMLLCHMSECYVRV